MKTLRTFVALVSLALMVGLTSCCIPGGQPLHEKTVSMTVAHVADSAVQATSKNGSLSVKAAERDDVEITAKLRMRSLERLDATEIKVERDDSDRLVLEVVWPEGTRKNNEGCSFTITVPDANGVELETGNGRIEIAGLSGEADLHTSNGRVSVESHKGDVTGRTSNGRITVGNTEGDIDLRTSNGKIEVVAAPQSVKVTTSNGSVSVALADDGEGPVDIGTSNGSVTLEIGPGFKGELRADTSNGKVNVSNLSDVQMISSGKHHVHLKVGDSDNTSRIKSSNGSVNVRAR